MNRLLALTALAASAVVGTPLLDPIWKHEPVPNFAQACSSFQSKMNIPNTRVASITHIPVGSNYTATTPASCSGEGLGLTLPAGGSPYEFCRIILNVTTSASSQIYMEAWLPSNYSGRYLTTGNGGLGGCVMYPDMYYAASYGFATIGSNNGHFGDTGVYFGNTEILEDFAYRSLHTITTVGKQITNQFYSQGFKKSYYLGCSTGGREGWKAVQAFPDDFDGVIAGSPAINFVNLLSWSLHFFIATGTNTSDSFVTTPQWTTVHNEILRQCDDLDGAADGLIEDPDLCQPVFETLLCAPGESSKNGSCLTAPQLGAVNTIFSDMLSLNASVLYPRMQPGSELMAEFIYYNGAPFSYPSDWYHYVVLNNTKWDPATWTVADAMKAAAQDPFNISTWNPDLSAFQKKGGKVLHFHGMEDPIISSENSKNYYKHVSDSMGLGPDSLDDFYRFFRISGMAHCQGGDGASNIGQGLGTPWVNDPQSNILLALVDWVEKDSPPEFIRGIAYNGTEVQYTRKHCKYPTRNRYVGPGSFEDEDSWECV